MLKLILSRLLQGVLVLLIISFLIFALLARAGGDAVSMLDNTRASEETTKAIRRLEGLDRPLMERYRNWVADVARGNLGDSLILHTPVWSLIRLPLLRTGVLAMSALLTSWLISLSLGVAAARRAGSRIDRFCSVVVLLASSTPQVVVALLALALISSTPLFRVI